MFVFKCPVHRVAKDAKNPKAEAALARLGTFLDNSSPQLVEWLYSLFQDQQKAVTYAELREAWLDGYESLIREWQEDYARFIADKLAPEIRKAAAAGGNAVLDRLGPNAFYIIDSDEAVKAWISTHTAELVTNISDSARKAINAIVLRGQTDGWTTDRMAYAIRPVIGLTIPQAQANANYFQHILDTIREARPNISDADASRMASEAALKYAAQQHRYRANMIANTELAYAYNNGAHETTRKAIQEGLMGACVKIWSTAADSRVCPICQDLDGMQVGFDGYFGEKEKNHGRGFTMLPPAHPGCRCAVLYEEVSPARVTLPKPDEGAIMEQATRAKIDTLKREIDRQENAQKQSWTAERDNQLGGLYKQLEAAKIDAAKKGVILTSKLEETLAAADIKAIIEKVKAAPEDIRIMWNRFEDKMKILSATHNGTAIYENAGRGIRFNLQSDRKDGRIQKPYKTIFHELGHLMDHCTGRNRFYFSHRYDGGAFGETLRQEAKEYANAVKKKLQAEALQQGRNPKYVRLSDAYDQIGLDLRRIAAYDRREISDIWHGATNKKVDGGFGHYETKNYWGNDENLPAEAFAHMVCATIQNPESLALIKQYFPKSYEKFQEIVKNIAQKGGI